MRKLSITTKITIWYVVFLLLLTVCFFGIMIYTGNIRATELAKTKLMGAVSDSGEEINSVGENFIIDDDLKFYEDGVYISVYDEKSELIEGQIPAEIAKLPAIKEENLEKLTGDENSTWYIYDKKLDINGKTVWVRGIVKDFAEESTFTFMLKISAVAFPLMVILAVIGGYIITRRAFRPVRKIIKTAQGISRDGDLSKRIELDAPEQGENKAADEIHHLALEFNNMFGRLEESFEKEKRFTSDVSHELRTPLAVIISQSEYGLEDESYSRQALEVINREGRRMSGLVNRLLTIARSDSGRLNLQREKVDFSEMCEMVALQQTHIAGEHNINLEYDIEPEIFVYGDEAMLMRILLNVVDNGIKYGKENGNLRIMLRSEDLKVREHDERAGKYAKVSVEDDGIGISKENLDKIWERFYREDSSRSREGSGLGLAMVKALVKAHEGHIEVRSTVGKGSCFDIYIPMAEEKGEEAECENENRI